MWSKLDAAQDPLCTTYPSNQCNLLCLNDNELIFIPRADKTGAWIWKYNIQTDCMAKWIEIPKSMQWVGHTSSLDKQNKILYIYDSSGYIITIDLNRKAFSKSKSSYQSVFCPRSAFINGTFHLFKYSSGNNFAPKSHCIWNKTDESLVELFNFDNACASKLMSPFSMKHLSDQLLMILPTIEKYQYLYSVSTHTLTKTAFKFNEYNTLIHNTILSTDGRYIICFVANLNNKAVLRDNIWLFDTETLDTFNTKIAAPSWYYGHLCLRNKTVSIQALTFEYVRQCWKLEEFSSIEYLPVYLIQIIEKFADSLDVLHFMNPHGHWSITVDDVLGNIET